MNDFPVLEERQVITGLIVRRAGDACDQHEQGEHDRTKRRGCDFRSSAEHDGYPIIPPMALDGFLFDMDGTLVDSNGAHVEAWRRAFARYGYNIPADRIFYEIGKGGDHVVPHLIGEQANERDGEKLRPAEAEEFGKIAETDGLNVFPGAKELIEAVQARGLKAVLATSSKPEQLNKLEKASGVQWRTLFDEVVTAGDVEASKPSPDVVSAAVAKLKVSPAQCAMLGDTPYDAEACKHAGVVCLGVTCGGRDAATLMKSGMRRVYRGPAEVLACLDDALKLASPGELHLSRKVLEELMRQALEAAREGMNDGEVPIGAVLADRNGAVIGRAYNELNRTQNATAHAEMVAFAKAAGRYAPEARDTILVSTLEPCVMCLGASMEAAVDTVVYGMKAPADSGTGRVTPPQSPESQTPRIVGDILADESRALFEEWLARPGNNPRQVQFVRQLLSLTS